VVDGYAIPSKKDMMHVKRKKTVGPEILFSNDMILINA
jgi:hypothetical protein